MYFDCTGLSKNDIPDWCIADMGVGVAGVIACQTILLGISPVAHLAPGALPPPSSNTVKNFQQAIKGTYLEDPMFKIFYGKVYTVYRKLLYFS